MALKKPVEREKPFKKLKIFDNQRDRDIRRAMRLSEFEGSSSSRYSETRMIPGDDSVKFHKSKLFGLNEPILFNSIDVSKD